VRPDGYGVWREHTTSLPFLYGHDKGNGHLECLARKLDGYARLAEAGRHPNWVLFSFGFRGVRPRPAGCPAAGSSLSPSVPAPDGPVWLAVGTDATTRLRLVDFASLPIARA